MKNAWHLSRHEYEREVGEFRMAKWADVVAWIDALVAKSQAGSDVTP